MQTNEILLIEYSTYFNIRYEIFGWICTYIYRQNLALNDLQMLIYHKMQPTNQPTTCTKGLRGPVINGYKAVISDSRENSNHYFFGKIGRTKMFMLLFLTLKKNPTIWRKKLKKKWSKCNIMAEGFRFIYLAFGFSQAENLSAQCMGYLDATWTCGADVSFRDVKIKIPNREMWMTSWTGSERGGFWGIWKKSVELRRGHRTRRVDFGGSQRPDEFCALWAPHKMGGGRWKSHPRKILPLSLCRKTFKLKGNKKFRAWTKKS